ncbi:MAG: Hsp20/alpha crystallin family protein [Chromatiaceae bacterium]
MKTKSPGLREATPRREIDVFDNLDRVFDTRYRGWMRPFRELFPEWAPLTGRREFAMPHLDLIEREEEILVRVEIPGVDKKDLRLELTGDLLTIAGERRLEEEIEEDEVHRAEIARGTFTRSIRLPVPIDHERVDADFKDGLLEIHLPKAHETEHRRIEIK